MSTSLPNAIGLLLHRGGSAMAAAERPRDAAG
jgi:hypothetical protein